MVIPEDNEAVFPGQQRNAQLLLHGDSFASGLRAVSSAEFCSTPPRPPTAVAELSKRGG